MYGSFSTTGGTMKFSVGGGEGVCHSSPVDSHGFAGAFLPYRIDQTK